MTSKPGQQRIATYILLNISRLKGNQTMKFHQLIEHPKGNIFFLEIVQKSSFRSLFGFKKSFILGKSKWSAA